MISGASKRSPICLKSALHIVTSASYAACTLAFDAATSCVVTSIVDRGGAGSANSVEAGIMDEPTPRASATTLLRIAVIDFIVTFLPLSDTLGGRCGAVEISGFRGAGLNGFLLQRRELL